MKERIWFYHVQAEGKIRFRERVPFWAWNGEFDCWIFHNICFVSLRSRWQAREVAGEILSRPYRPGSSLWMPTGAILPNSCSSFDKLRTNGSVWPPWHCPGLASEPYLNRAPQLTSPRRGEESRWYYSTLVPRNCQASFVVFGAILLAGGDGGHGTPCPYGEGVPESPIRAVKPPSPLLSGNLPRSRDRSC